MVESCDAEQFVLFDYSGDCKINGSKSFNCGNDVINRFVTKDNIRQQAKGSGNPVKVLLDISNENQLVGFYTIYSHYLERDILSSAGLGNVCKLPRVPVVKLVMLGVSEQYQKRGLGKKLMNFAFENTRKVAEHIGVAGLYLEADKNAVDFYVDLGFTLLGEPNQRGASPMFIDLDTLNA